MRPQDRTNLAPATPASTRSEDLFATVYEQTQRVLGKTCGFYFVTHDTERSIARVAYHTDSGSAARIGVTFDAAECDVLTRRHPLIDDGFARLLAEGVISSIAVPLVRNGEALGSFGAYSRSAAVYDARDARALEAIAEVAALALENARFLSEIEKARLEAERLEEIGRAISGSLELTEVLRRIVDAAQTLTGADASTVWLLCSDDEVEVAMSIGEIAPQQGLRFAVPSSLRQRMVDMRQPYFVYEDLKSGDHELPLNLRNLTKARSTMAVALMADDHILGALSVGHLEPVHYSDADIRLLERLSFQAAVAVANARLHEQVSALSLTDPLTDMPNRRHLEIFMQKEFAAARRGRRLSVLLFDLNNFKIYNDRDGHQAGDKALRAFGSLLVTNTRAMNLAARLGGDEFITILADTDLAGAQAHAERIINEIAADALLAGAGLSASVGIATYDSAMETYDDLINAADEDLYLRKKSRTA